MTRAISEQGQSNTASNLDAQAPEGDRLSRLEPTSDQRSLIRSIKLRVRLNAPAVTLNGSLRVRVDPEGSAAKAVLLVVLA